MMVMTIMQMLMNETYSLTLHKLTCPKEVSIKWALEPEQESHQHQTD